MRLKRTSVLLVSWVSCMSIITGMAVAEVLLGPELIVNGDFESKGDPYPGWTLDTTTQSPIVDAGGAHGSVLEARKEGNWTAGWAGRYGGSQEVAVTKGATYKLELDRYTVAAPHKWTGIAIHEVQLVSADPTIWWRSIWEAPRGEEHVFMHPPDNEWIHHTVYVEALSTTITINSYGVHLSTLRIDNVSLKKVLKADAGTATDYTAVSIPARPGKWPAWIADQKIRAAFDFEHVDDRSHLAKLAASGFNTVLLSFAALDVDTPDQIALLDKQAGWCAELGLRMFVITRLCGDKPESRYLVPGGRSYVDRSGFALTRTPCPSDPVFWEKVITRRARLVAKHSLTHRIDGYMFDPEMYAANDSKFTGYCYCEYCFREFFEHRSLTVEIPLPAGRVPWLKKQGLQKTYAAWKEERAEAFARATEQAVHGINPDLVLGVLVLDVDRWYYNAWARGFGTARMPVIAFSESTYRTGATEYLQRARRHLKQINAHAVLCASIWAQKFSPEEIPGQLFNLAQGTIGYWVFSTYGFSKPPEDPPTNDFTFSPPHDGYLKAFSLAAQELDRQKKEGRRFTPKLKLVPRDPPRITVYDDGLLSPAVELYPFDPKGQRVSPNEKPTRLIYEAAFYVLVTAGDTITGTLKTYKEQPIDKWPEYRLIAPSGEIAAEGGLTVGNPVSLNVPATETGLYKLALTTKANLFSVELNMPHFVQSVNDTVSIVKQVNRMYFYVPEDCTEFFIKVRTPYLAEQAEVVVWDPSGEEVASAETVELTPAVATLHPTSKQRGKVWSFQMVPVYYSVHLIWDPRLPPYLAESPEALLLPTSERR